MKLTIPSIALLLMPLNFIACGDKPVDDDGDGFLNTEECDDSNPAISPKATDLVGDGFDQNCDGVDGTDSDGDGVASIISGGTDCDDEDPEINAPSVFYQDFDGDGFGNSAVTLEACEVIIGFVTDNTDCDDLKWDVHPEATEVCDEVDNDCDDAIDLDDDSVEGLLTVYSDVDLDGFGDASTAQQVCFFEEGLVSDDTDCDDSDAAVHPAATEILGDGIDNDCDEQELCYEDLDGDGFGTDTMVYLPTAGAESFSCAENATASLTADDCDDGDANVHPAAVEVCDGIDNDCDGLSDDEDDSTDLSTGMSFYMDVDQDGYGDEQSPVEACVQATNMSLLVGDCNDVSPSTNPLATDIYGDAIDQNCDGADGIDADGDGVASAQSGGNDCDDTNAQVLSDTDGDGDGWTCAEDCDDANALVFPTAEDIAGDGVDQDCDGADTPQAPMFGDLINPDDNALALLCGSYNVVYGDLTIDMSNLNSNSTADLSCLSAVYGDLTINNINSLSEIAFPNLYTVGNLFLDGGLVYDFSALQTAASIEVVSNQSTTFDGDSYFPVLENITHGFTWSFGLSDRIIGFSNLTALGELTIQDDVMLTDVTGFTNITELESLTINNTYMTDISSPSLTTVNVIEIRNNDLLMNTTGLQNLSSTVLLTITNDDVLQEDGCMYYTPDTNIFFSEVTFNGFDVGDCDLDGDSFTLNDGDCDDQDSTLELLDVDGDGFSTCDDDCDDNDGSIRPNATEVWYDGVDQNCDGLNDFDQDGDSDDAFFFGGTDCDDMDVQLNGLDLDADGVSTCDGDNLEPVESCAEWLDVGVVADGVYPLTFANGDSFDVYCDMNTQGGGWTLFAVTDANDCVEDLAYGGSELLSLNTAYFSLLTADVEHTEFLQQMRTDGSNIDYTIQWTFLDGTQTVQDRFMNAYSAGEAVSWQVNFNGFDYAYTGSWRFSDAAFGWGNNPWNAGNGGSFSDDDGIWGAANGEVNGNTTNEPLWGHGVLNSNDNSDCSKVYFNGDVYSSNSLRNQMFFR